MDNLNQSNIFSTDYRSVPSGVGSIKKSDGSLIMIQYKGCNPELVEGIYSDIIYIDYDFGVDFKEASEELLRILEEHNVSFIYDYDLAEDMDLDNGYIPYDQFAEFRRFYY